MPVDWLPGYLREVSGVMGKNRSKIRKNERVERAEQRKLSMLVRNCGHWHTDNGYQNCADKTDNNTP